MGFFRGDLEMIVFHMFLLENYPVIYAAGVFGSIATAALYATFVIKMAWNHE